PSATESMSALYRGHERVRRRRPASRRPRPPLPRGRCASVDGRGKVDRGRKRDYSSPQTMNEIAVLVLNFTYEPLHFTNAKRAITLLLSGKAETVETSPRIVRS